MADTEFNSELGRKVELVNETLHSLVSEREQIEPALKEAMEYTLNAPGKRIRAALLMWCCEAACGSINDNAKIAAAAVEMVHTYSLIHDDLPAMDDDDLRRGRATCHKAFDEATAILAGDGLLTLAFEVLAKEIDDKNISIALIGRLAEAAGPYGMIAGQMADLRAEKSPGGLELLEYIHTNKTARMFEAASVMGGIVGGADENKLERLGKYGLKIGLGFQIADDILDVSASSEQLGKTAGKDVRAGKMTYPSLVGVEESRRLERQLALDAIAAIESFGEKADKLRQLAKALLERIR